MADLSIVGAAVGFIVSVIVSAALFLAALRIDRDEERGQRWMGCTCLLRLAALLVLTFGLGIGYMIGRALGK